jgi:hypothetical protein
MNEQHTTDTASFILRSFSEGGLHYFITESQSVKSANSPNLLHQGGSALCILSHKISSFHNSIPIAIGTPSLQYSNTASLQHCITASQKVSKIQINA